MVLTRPDSEVLSTVEPWWVFPHVGPEVLLTLWTMNEPIDGFQVVIHLGLLGHGGSLRVV